MSYNLTAPLVFHKGKKKISNDFLMVEMDIVAWIFNNLPYSEARYLLLLIGVSGKGNFRLSTEYARKITRLDRSKQSKARETLIELGILEYIPKKSLTINFDVLYALAEDYKET